MGIRMDNRYHNLNKVLDNLLLVVQSSLGVLKYLYNIRDKL